MRFHPLAAWTCALAAFVALAATARAGDAVKLSLELPKDVTSVEAGGGGVDVKIQCLDATGAKVGLGDKTLEVSATNGDFVLAEAPFKFHYKPPASVDKSSSVKLRAWLKQSPDVSGEATLTLVPHGAKAAEEVSGVVWPTGDVKLLVWRAKDDPKQDWNDAPKRKLPEAGKALIAPHAFQFLRVTILRDDVKKVEVEAWVDKKSSAVRTDDADKNGPLHLEKKDGRTDAVLIYEVPMDGKARIVNLLLTTADGKILTEEFQLMRGKDKDGDGEKDKKK
jgi:hypothetical protein